MQERWGNNWLPILLCVCVEGVGVIHKELDKHFTPIVIK
jgi:hypothetical protein